MKLMLSPRRRWCRRAPAGDDMRFSDCASVGLIGVQAGLIAACLSFLNKRRDRGHPRHSGAALSSWQSSMPARNALNEDNLIASKNERVEQ
jgi:hypothetical protein